MTKHSLHRRAFLRGLGGTAVALPLLEIMTTKVAKAAVGADPCRYLVAFGGVSLGTYDDLTTPSQTGVGYESTLGLEPLFDYGVNGDVSVFSGMKIPWKTGSSTPAGGRSKKYHAYQLAPIFTGTHTTDNRREPIGPSSEQIVADSIGQGTTFHTLNYRVQAAYYRGSNGSGGTRGRMSYRATNSGAAPIDPTVSPRIAYDTLFTSFAAADPEEELQRQFLLSRRQSVLDLVGRVQRDRLINRLGGEDKRRMDRHFTEIRELETRLNALAPEISNATCQNLGDPGADPEIGGIGRQGPGEPMLIDQGYSNEELRAQLLCDLIHMAFACDLTRSVSLMLSMEQCFLMAFDLFGYESDFHQLSHGGSGGNKANKLRAQTLAVQWHVKHFAYLVEKMKNTPEGDGTLLDNAAMVLHFEGGHGYDPQTNEQDKPHSTENMVSLLAGRAGGLVPGRHVRAVNRHPTELTISAMNAVGAAGGLGELDNPIDSAFG